MGLDISAYRQLKKAPDAELDDDGYPRDWARFIHFTEQGIASMEQQWPGRSEGVSPGVYSYAESLHFRAGSYGGYNHWRDWLARLAGWKSDRGCWDDPKAGGPFFELINFSDAEGIIGPVVAAKLAKDFAEHQQKAESVSSGEDGEYYIKKYNEWRKAFEMAADGGAVDFH